LNDKLLRYVNHFARIKHAKRSDLTLHLRLEWWRVLPALRCDFDARVVDDDEPVAFGFGELLRAFAHRAVDRLPLQTALAINFKFLQLAPLLGLQAREAKRVHARFFVGASGHRFNFLDARFERGLLRAAFVHRLRFEFLDAHVPLSCFIETVEELGKVDDADRSWRRRQHHCARRTRAADEEPEGGDGNARGECGDGRASIERKCERWHR
jgi:hypothetical protein